MMINYYIWKFAPVDISEILKVISKYKKDKKVFKEKYGLNQKSFISSRRKRN